MTDNLPATRDAAPVSLGGQTAMWDDPDGLLTLPVLRLRELAAEVGREAGSVLAQVRRVAGLTAWAGWHRLNAKEYEPFLAGLAADLGVQPRTIVAWRDGVADREHLARPALAAPPKPSRKRPPANGKDKTHTPANVAGKDSEHLPAADALSAPREAAPTTPEREVPPSPAVAAPGPPEEPEAVDIDAVGLRWLRSKTAPQIRAIGDPWGPAIRAEVARWAGAMGLAGQKAIPSGQAPRTRLEDRPAARSAYPSQNGAPARSLERREVEPMFKKA